MRGRSTACSIATANARFGRCADERRMPSINLVHAEIPTPPDVTPSPRSRTLARACVMGRGGDEYKRRWHHRELELDDGDELTWMVVEHSLEKEPAVCSTAPSTIVDPRFVALSDVLHIGISSARGGQFPDCHPSVAPGDRSLPSREARKDARHCGLRASQPAQRPLVHRLLPQRPPWWRPRGRRLSAARRARPPRRRHPAT